MNITKPNYLSPSTINSFVEYRHSWYYTKILGGPFASTHYFERGKAIEHGIRMVLEGADIDEAVNTANRMMSASFAILDLSPEDQEQCAEYAMMMRDYINCGVNALKPYGPLVDSKHKDWTDRGIRIEYKHPQIAVPLYGYLDFFYEKSAVVDLKVLSKKPSSLSQGYLFQGMIYRWGTNLPVSFEVLSHTKTRGVEATRLNLASNTALAWQEQYLIASANTLLAVYDAVAAGDTVSLLRLMSFPNIDGVFNKKERDALYSEFVSNAKFLVEQEEAPAKESPKEADIKAIANPDPKPEPNKSHLDFVGKHQAEEKEKKKKGCPF